MTKDTQLSTFLVLREDVTPRQYLRLLREIVGLCIHGGLNFKTYRET